MLKVIFYLSENEKECYIFIEKKPLSKQKRIFIEKKQSYHNLFFSKSLTIVFFLGIHYKLIDIGEINIRDFYSKFAVVQGQDRLINILLQPAQITNILMCVFICTLYLDF